MTARNRNRVNRFEPKLVGDLAYLVSLEFP
jgi:hypothetical protein